MPFCLHLYGAALKPCCISLHYAYALSGMSAALFYQIFLSHPSQPALAAGALGDHI